jgi:ferredoxin
VGIPVRDFARQGRVVDDARCVQCGQCIEACPRGTLRWGRVLVDTHAADEREYQRLLRVFFPGEGEAQ